MRRILRELELIGNLTLRICGLSYLPGSSTITLVAGDVVHVFCDGKRVRRRLLALVLHGEDVRLKNIEERASGQDSTVN